MSKASGLSRQVVRLSECFEQLYPELTRLASMMVTRDPSHALVVSELVCEALARLRDHPEVLARGEADAKRCFAVVCRRMLVSMARKRAIRLRLVPVGRAVGPQVRTGDHEVEFEVMALHDALGALQKVDPGWAEIANLRLFGGLRVAECAVLARVPESAMAETWQRARDWLQHRLG